MSLRGAALRHGSLGLVGVMVQGAVRFLSNLLIGRLGGPGVLAAVATATSVALLLSLLGPTSLASAAAKFVARASGMARTSERHDVCAFLVRRFLVVAGLLAAAAGSVWIAAEGSSWIDGACVTTLVVGYSAYNFARGFQFGSGRILRATVWDVATAILGLAGVAVMLVSGMRGIVVLTPIAAAYMVFSAGNWPRAFAGRPPIALRREMDAFVVFGTLGTLAGSGFLQSSMIVARLGDSTVAAGDYAAAMTLATPVSLISMAVGLVLFPMMARTWGDGAADELRPILVSSTRLILLATVPTIGVLALNSALVVHVLWGPSFAGAAALLPVLLAAIAATVVAVPSVNSLTATSARGVRVSTVVTVCGAAVGVICWAVLVPMLGATGVALGYLVGSVTVAVLSVVAAARAHSLRRTDPWRKGLFGTVVCGALLVAQQLMPFAFWNGPLFSLAFLGIWAAINSADLGPTLSIVTARSRFRSG